MIALRRAVHSISVSFHRCQTPLRHSSRQFLVRSADSPSAAQLLIHSKSSVAISPSESKSTPSRVSFPLGTGALRSDGPVRTVETTSSTSSPTTQSAFAAADWIKFVSALTVRFEEKLYHEQFRLHDEDEDSVEAEWLNADRTDLDIFLIGIDPSLLGRHGLDISPQEASTRIANVARYLKSIVDRMVEWAGQQADYQDGANRDMLQILAALGRGDISPEAFLRDCCIVGEDS